MITAWDSAMGLKVGNLEKDIFLWRSDIGIPTRIYNTIAIRFNIVNTEQENYAVGIKINGV
jgi:hypothetical protein